ncbi:MAG: hypothetical protein ACI9FU_000177 [Granulosicoccus sp.]|jgi:hypothetical protein
MKILRFLPLLSLVFLFGCPYQSQVPVSEATLELENVLIGKWQKVESVTDENPSFLDISKADEFHFSILEFQYDKTDSIYKSKAYSAHLSKVGAHSFVNLLENQTPPYMIYQLDRTGNSTFILREVTDNIDEKFNTSTDLAAFLKKHAELSFLYSNEEMAYQRMKD